MAQPASSSPDRRPLLAFLTIVALGGLNAVAVRFSNLALPPFWSAAARYLLAAPFFWAILWWRKTPLPRGRVLAGAVLYGVLTIGLYNALLYWALVYITASLTTVILSLIPLLTLLSAILHRQEAFSWRALLGGLVAFLGILLAVGGQLNETDLPLIPMLAIVVAALLMAEATVLYKGFPHADPVAANAVILSIGAPILLLISYLAGEPWVLPSGAATWAAFIYLVLGGSVALFYLLLYVLHAWTASATNYIFLLGPISAIVFGAWLLGEPVTARFLLGGAVAMAGVYMGAIQSRAKT